MNAQKIAHWAAPLHQLAKVCRFKAGTPVDNLWITCTFGLLVLAKGESPVDADQERMHHCTILILVHRGAKRCLWITAPTTPRVYRPWWCGAITRQKLRIEVKR